MQATRKVLTRTQLADHTAMQQMERVYLTITIDSVCSTICLLSWPQITDLILWAAKRELITLRIDEKLGQIRQRAAQANAAMSVEVRDTLAKFAASLEAVAERLGAVEIKKRKAEYCRTALSPIA